MFRLISDASALSPFSMSCFSLDSQLSLSNDDGSSLLAIRDVQSNTRTKLSNRHSSPVVCDFRHIFSAFSIVLRDLCRLDTCTIHNSFCIPPPSQFESFSICRHQMSNHVHAQNLHVSVVPQHKACQVSTLPDPKLTGRCEKNVHNTLIPNRGRFVEASNRFHTSTPSLRRSANRTCVE